MIKLGPYEVCLRFNDCEYKIDFIDGGIKNFCKGCDPERGNIFICDFYVEKKTLLQELLEDPEVGDIDVE